MNDLTILGRLSHLNRTMLRHVWIVLHTFPLASFLLSPSPPPLLPPLLPQVSMAHKVLSSDMAHLVEAMKNAQKHHQTFLEQEYRKQMFQAAHIVAVNSKQLMDAVNSARRKAHLMQR